jgi:flagellar motor switch protein FliM
VANILSQEEIDALMGALEEEQPSPEEPAALEEDAPRQSRPASVAVYDFRRPNRAFFKEQLRIFQTIHDTFARQFAASLSGYLRSMVEVEIVSADQLTYGEYVLSLPTTTSLFIFGIEPLEGQGVLEINPSLVLSMIDRLFGGTGGKSDFTRELTDIETAVMTKLVQRGLSVLAHAWEGVVKMRPQLREHETKPVMMQLLANTESVVLITFELRMMNTSGTLSVCYPYTAMEPIIPRISNTKLIRRRGDRDPAARQWIQTTLTRTDVQVVAELGCSEITIEEFLKLKVGDVLVLERGAREAIDLKVHDVTKAKVRPGLQGRHRVVQVEALVATEPDVWMTPEEGDANGFADAA